MVFAEGVPAETLLNVEESAVNFAEYFRRYGTPTTEEAWCAPLVHIGGRSELKSRLRSGLSGHTTQLAPFRLEARKRERVRCSPLVDWPVYPRLAYTMRASNGAQSVADPALRRCLPPLPAMEPWASVARPEALARDSGAAGGGSRRAAAQRVSQARRYDPPAPAACVP